MAVQRTAVFCNLLLSLFNLPELIQLFAKGVYLSLILIDLRRSGFQLFNS